MLMEWLRGAPAEEAVKEDAKTPKKRMQVDPEGPLEPVGDEAIKQREKAIARKLAASAKEGPPNPNKMVSYDSIFRSANRVMMEGNMAEVGEGLTVNMSRNTQNTMVSSKWSIINPQMSNWEVTLQMNGFTDIAAVTYNTLNRWQLMYQRVSSTGAMIVTQIMAQRMRGMTHGTVFGMLQYPTVAGGCTQVQYVKDQNFTVSHMQRLIRGFYVGTSMSCDPNTKGTSLSYAATVTNPLKTASVTAELNPSKGEWKVALTRAEWATDVTSCVQLEYGEGRNGKASALSFGTRKMFIGGGSVTIALKNFEHLKTSLELPFGGTRPNMNQVRLQYSSQYDIHSGALKHGITLTA